MKLCKLLLAVVGATVLLGALVSTASATHLRSSTQSFRATWTRSEFTGGFVAARCNLTLEGSLHSATINKTAGSLIGYITRASVGPCESGSATVLTATLPWHVQYASFTGTLPSSIATIVTHVIGAAWRIREGGFSINCLTTSSAGEPSVGTYNLTGGSVTSVTLGGTTNCEGINGTLRGTSATNSAQTITLI